MAKHGYHVTDIPRGVYGEPSKVLEEAFEFIDATKQKSHVMAILELSDLIGAIQAWLMLYHPSVSIDDLVTMSQITSRAFEAGERKNSDS